MLLGVFKLKSLHMSFFVSFVYYVGRMSTLVYLASQLITPPRFPLTPNGPLAKVQVPMPSCHGSIFFCGAVKIHYEIGNEAITQGLRWVFGQCETISHKAYKCVARESSDHAFTQADQRLPCPY